MASNEDPVVGVRFVVQVDDMSLGAFDTCEGLGCDVTIEQREEGGNNSYVWQLPSRLSYPNVTLSRPLSKDTEQVAKWIEGVATGVRRHTASISAMSPDGQLVAKWSLLDVVPVSWQGPSFQPSDAGVLMETVEIAHHGFMTSGA